MNEKDKLLLCKSWLEGWSGNRPEHLISFYSDDVYFQDPVRSGGIKGRASLLKYITKMLSRFPTWRWEFEEFIATGKGFVVKYSAKVPCPGGEFSFQGADILE